MSRLRISRVSSRFAPWFLGSVLPIVARVVQAEEAVKSETVKTDSSSEPSAPSAPTAPTPPTTPKPSSAPSPSGAPPAPGSVPVMTPNAGSDAPSTTSVAEPPATPADGDRVAAGPPPPGESASGVQQAAPAEVTIAGTRVANMAGSAHVVKSRVLDRFKYDDPHAALRAVPGVYSRGEDGVGLRPNIGIRGVNPDRSKKITLMEDGVLVAPATYSAPAAYYFPLMARMERLVVIKGPGAIGYGPQTVGGAVNLVTRAIPASTSGMVDAAAGEYGYNKLHGHFGSSDGNTGFLVEGVHLGSDGFKELPNGADTGFYRNEWMFKGRYALSAEGSHELLLKLVYSDEVSNETYLGITNADFHANPLQRYGASRLDRMKNFRTGISLSHVFEPAPNMSVTTTIYRSDFSRVWRKVNGFRGASLFDVLQHPNDARNAVYAAVISGRADSSSSGETLLIGPNQRDFVSQGIQTRARWDVKTGEIAHRIEYGMRVHQDCVERRHSEDPFLLIAGEPVPEGGPTVVTAFNEAWTEAIALHAADAITWRALTLTPGLRFEGMRSAFVDRQAHTEERGATHVFLPGVGAYVALADVFGVFAGAYRGFSPPAPGSTSSVKPELSVNYEGGARFSDRQWRAEAIGFYNDYSNITDVCTLSSGCVESNLDRQYDAGKARIYGVEAFVEHSPQLGNLNVPLTAAYTFTRAEFLNTFHSDDPIFGDVQSGDEMPYVPRHQISGSIGLESRNAGGAIGATYVSAMREEAGTEPLSNVLATDQQLTFDASASFRAIRNVSVYANVRNLLNDHSIVSHRPFGARPNAPRWVQVGLRATF